MKNFLHSLRLGTLLVLLSLTHVWAQTAPPSNISGSELRTWLKSNWFDAQISALGYNGARSAIYSYVDSQNGLVHCVYTNFTQPAAVTTYLNPINAEHTILNVLYGCPPTNCTSFVLSIS